MEGVNATLFKNGEKVFETSSKAALLESIRLVKEKTNQMLTEIIEATSSGGVKDGKKDAGNDSVENGEESDDDENGDPDTKKMKLTT